MGGGGYVAPAAVDGAWYGLRTGIELGFRALKSLGWPWERTRRTDPLRVARHWVVLALKLSVGQEPEVPSQHS